MDNFALLEERRRPWIEVETLKTKFLTLSSAVHPDRLHEASERDKKSATDRYSTLNAAYNCLRETKDRLAHLLQLELGNKPDDVQKIPSASMDLFMAVGTTLREVDAFLAQKAKITSPLMKAQIFENAMEWTDRLNALQQRINQSRDAHVAELRAMNAAWEAAPSGPERLGALPLTRLEEIYRAISFIARWTEQIQQRIVQLSL
jgi:DnaJ-domain-containing protein 1